MILADAHEHGYAGDNVWVVFLALLAVAMIVALVLLLRGKSRPGEGALRTALPGEPPAPPAPGAAGQDAPSSTLDWAGDPEQAMETYCARENEIMAVLKQKGRPVEQSELCQCLGLAEDELARYLAEMEQRGFLRRTWDHEHQVFMVGASPGV